MRMRGVIYARYSSDNQREESIEGQLRENTACPPPKKLNLWNKVRTLRLRFHQKRRTSIRMFFF